MGADPKLKARDARNTREHMARRAVELFQRAWPEQAAVKWERGGHVQWGVVVRHGYGDTLTAMNTRTGRVIKLTHGDVFRGEGLI